MKNEIVSVKKESILKRIIKRLEEVTSENIFYLYIMVLPFLNYFFVIQENKKEYVILFNIINLFFTFTIFFVQLRKIYFKNKTSRIRTKNIIRQKNTKKSRTKTKSKTKNKISPEKRTKTQNRIKDNKTRNVSRNISKTSNKRKNKEILKNNKNWIINKDIKFILSFVLVFLIYLMYILTVEKTEGFLNFTTYFGNTEILTEDLIKYINIRKWFTFSFTLNILNYILLEHMYPNKMPESFKQIINSSALIYICIIVMHYIFRISKDVVFNLESSQLIEYSLYAYLIMLTRSFRKSEQSDLALIIFIVISIFIMIQAEYLNGILIVIYTMLIYVLSEVVGYIINKNINAKKNKKGESKRLNNKNNKDKKINSRQNKISNKNSNIKIDSSFAIISIIFIIFIILAIFTYKNIYVAEGAINEQSLRNITYKNTLEFFKDNLNISGVILFVIPYIYIILKAGITGIRKIRFLNSKFIIYFNAAILSMYLGTKYTIYIVMPHIFILQNIIFLSLSIETKRISSKKRRFEEIYTQLEKNKRRIGNKKRLEKKERQEILKRSEYIKKTLNLKNRDDQKLLDSINEYVKQKERQKLKKEKENIKQKNIIFITRDLNLNGRNRALIDLANNLSNTYNVKMLTIFKKYNEELQKGITNKKDKDRKSRNYRSYLKKDNQTLEKLEVRSLETRRKENVDLRNTLKGKNRNSNVKNIYQMQQELSSQLDKNIDIKYIFANNANIKYKYMYLKYIYSIYLKLKYKGQFDTIICFNLKNSILLNIANAIDSENSILWIHDEKDLEDVKYAQIDKFQSYIFLNEKIKKIVLDNEEYYKIGYKNTKVLPTYLDARRIGKEVCKEDQEERKIKELFDMNKSKIDPVFNIVSINKLEHEKAIDRLLHIHERLIQEGYNHKIYIIGEGKGRKYLEKLIEAMRLEETFIILAATNNPYKYIRKANIFVYLPEKDGFGLVVREAKLLDTNILLTDTSSNYNEKTQNNLKEKIKAYIEDENNSTLINLDINESKNGKAQTYNIQDLSKTYFVRNSEVEIYNSLKTILEKAEKEKYETIDKDKYMCSFSNSFLIENEYILKEIKEIIER